MSEEIKSTKTADATDLTNNVEAVAEAEKIKKPKRAVNYLNNKDILKQVILSKQQGRMTDELAKMLTLLCQRYASRGNYAGYTFNEDMQAFALMGLCRTWASFNELKGSNPFAYYTQCIKNNFNMFLGAEKKQRNIRDALLVANGMSPSFTYQIENGMTPEDEDAQYQFEPISTQNMYDPEEY